MVRIPTFFFSVPRSDRKNSYLSSSGRSVEVGGHVPDRSGQGKCLWSRWTETVSVFPSGRLSGSSGSTCPLFMYLFITPNNSESSVITPRFQQPTANSDHSWYPSLSLSLTCLSLVEYLFSGRGLVVSVNKKKRKEMKKKKKKEKNEKGNSTPHWVNR